MLNWTSTSHLLPYVIFGAAWAFLCGVTIASVPAHGQPGVFPAVGANVTLNAPELSAPGYTAP